MSTTFSPDLAADIIYDACEKIKNIGLRELCWWVIARNPEMVHFPASIGKHQGYEGGYYVHLCEILRDIYKHYPSGSEDYDIMVTALLYHDIGKATNYRLDSSGNWVYTDAKKLFGHLVVSFTAFAISAQKLFESNLALTDDVHNHVAHIILSHHGRKIWGSPIEPQTPLAVKFHEFDLASACRGEFAFTPPTNERLLELRESLKTL